ncbi:MAG: tetratricopeptide repeat protein [Anaerolineales bacterium]|nr:tetratricopeptide repeat protein [Anaerolineales bacterium]
MDYSFGTWVKRRRKALDLTQQELARQIGCSPSLIFKIESDERRPSRQMAELLARQLNIPTEQQSIFLKTARQEKSAANLDSIPPLSGIEPDSAPRQNPGNLPVSPTPLVGREHELNVITKQLLEPACRLLTLTGPGGIGKTRLSIEVARQLEAHFTDGVYFISLAGIGMSDSMLSVIANVLGLGFSGPAEPIVQLASFLRQKQILLVFDNMEHLLAGGSLLGEILQQTQYVKMIVTSREQLRLQWEWLFEVQGLPIPEETDFQVLENNSAIKLFIQRARQASQNFSLEAEDTAALVRICKLVGGLPLAIELAASWARILSCREIVQELEKSLDFLETRKLDVPLRHRSIKTVFDHSWKLLADDERDLLMKLSVFQGGFTRDAANAATGTSLSLLSSLVDKSLLHHSKNADRYDLHELIRQYAFTQLQSHPLEEERASEKFAEHYANWISALEAPFKSALQPQTSHQIRVETNNWRSSWNWAIEHQRLDLLRKMTPCLNWYFEVHGYYDEALTVFKSAVDGFRAHSALTDLKSAKEKTTFSLVLDSLGWFEARKGNIELAVPLLAESLEIARETNDTEVLYYIYGNWGYVSLMTGDAFEAGRLTAESLRYGKMLTPWHTAIPTSVLGIVAYQQGNLVEAQHQLTESLKIWRTVGDPRGLVFCMLYLGMTTIALNNIPDARVILQESNDIAEANMDRWAHAFGLDMIGITAQTQGQYEEALDYFKQSLALYKEISDRFNSTQITIRLGQAYAALQSNDEAKRLFLEAYASAQSSKWIPILLNAFLSYVETQHDLPAETKLAAALSILSHSAVTPNLRARSECLRDELSPCIQAHEFETVEKLVREKNAEALAQEIMK